MYNHPLNARQADNAEILDFLPAIIAGSTKSISSCDPDVLNLLKGKITLVIECDLNLNGASITLPRGAKLVYEGGNIFNGTLVYNQGTIDGRLLSLRYRIAGQVKLLDPVFIFTPAKWAIVQTSTTDPRPPAQTVAYKNHKNLQYAVNLAKRLGATTFNIGALNAYFDTGSNSVGVLSLPSNFHLKMSNRTYLRVLPVNRDFTARMLRVYNKDNVTVSGGHVIGDRLEHGPADGGSTMVWIVGSRNIVVDNVNLSLSSASGLTVTSILWPGQPGYIPSDTIRITNSTFDSNRNNNLSVTDGKNVIIENSRFYRAGNDMTGKYGPSLGTAPRIGIVIEPALRQRIENVTIRNNTVRESRTNSILAAGVFNVVMTGNTVDAGIGWTSAAGAKIINNTVIGGGVIGGYDGDYALSKSTDNVVSGNTIRDCGTGIYLTNDDIEVFDNQIINCKLGMMVTNLADSQIYNNTITSNVAESFGINARQSVNRVVIRDNTIKLTSGQSMYMVGVNGDNNQSGNVLDITRNKFEASSNSAMTYCSGLNITENEFLSAGFGFTNCKNVTVTNNIVDSQTGSAFGINKTRSSRNISITGNTFRNSSRLRLGAYGVQINTVGSNAVTENSGIIIDDNDISVVGRNYGLHSTNFDGMTITNNRITTEELVSIYFRGNNSVIQNNQTVNGVDIEGNGNTVSNN